MKKLTTEEILERLNNKYKEKYDFSNFSYKNLNYRFKIRCLKCNNEIETNVRELLYSNKLCIFCGKEFNPRNTKEHFIEKVSKIRDLNNFDFSNTIYKTIDEEVEIKCNRCGTVFNTTPRNFYQGKGCQICDKPYNAVKTVEEIISNFKKIQGNKYDYSLIKEYKNRYQKLPIICHEKDENGVEHGIFYQNYAKHYRRKQGCPKCNGGVKKNKDYYIDKAKKLHIDNDGNPLYSYHLIDEIPNSKTKIPIICKKHGIFYQTMDNHIQFKEGCPICNESKLEKEIRKALIENNIEFISQCNFKTLPWLKCEQYKRNGLTLDFYLPKYNAAIECQGEQHFRNRENSTFLTEQMVNQVKERDEIKYKLCKQNNINLYYFSNLDLEYPHKVYLNSEKLINVIIIN